ncbi:hypothetical protein ABK040_008059 [Willaertia magna]
MQIISQEDFHTAHSKIKKYINKTPLFKSEFYSKKLNANIYLKCESLQLTNSFKLRGSLNKLLPNNDNNENIKELYNGVITASGGNHGLGVCKGCQILNVPCHVFLNEKVPENKIEAIKQLNGIVHLRDEETNNEPFPSFQESNEAAISYGKKHNLLYVHPFDDIEIIKGQGTVGIEILEQFNEVNHNNEEIDAVVCSIGGGGLISGVSSYIKAVNPKIKVFGVETFGADSMSQSIEKGELITLPAITSIAEGLGAKRVADITFEIVKENVVKPIINVTDRDTVIECLNVLEFEKLLVEPTGGCSLAALEQIVDKLKLEKKEEKLNIVVILSGGNVALNKLLQYQKELCQ